MPNFYQEICYGCGKIAKTNPLTPIDDPPCRDSVETIEVYHAYGKLYDLNQRDAFEIRKNRRLDLFVYGMSLLTEDTLRKLIGRK